MMSARQTELNLFIERCLMCRGSGSPETMRHWITILHIRLVATPAR